MRFLLFLCGISILALGGAALGSEDLDRNVAFGFLSGAMSLGGGLVIAGLFSIRWFWHGLMAGGVLALLGFGRGVLNLPALLKYLSGNRDTPLPVLEGAVTLISLLLLVATVKTLMAERERRLIEQLEKEAEEEEAKENESAAGES